MNELKKEGIIKEGIKIWLRYVDDIFATVSRREQAEQILTYLNEQHPNLRFTIEHETSNELPFLDTSVERKVNKYSRKNKFTGVYLNWTSLTSKKYKFGLIRCLADRIWKICSEPAKRDVELKEMSNGWPFNLTDCAGFDCLPLTISVLHFIVFSRILLTMHQACIPSTMFL